MTLTNNINYETKLHRRPVKSRLQTLAG